MVACKPGAVVPRGLVGVSVSQMARCLDGAVAAAGCCQEPQAGNLNTPRDCVTDTCPAAARWKWSTAAARRD
jgi:hypothetical protein